MFEFAYHLGRNSNTSRYRSLLINKSTNIRSLFASAMASGSEIDMLKYLSETTLQKLDGSEEKLQASELWKERGVVVMVIRRPGCLLCREEAQCLSAILPKIRGNRYDLVGVVQEALGVEEFRPFFKGELYLDSERRFYGPQERWLTLTGLFRPSVWRSMYAAWGVPGNLQGEGRLLGGLFVIGPQKKGILLDHKESQFGDKALIKDIIVAMESN